MQPPQKKREKKKKERRSSTNILFLSDNKAKPLLLKTKLVIELIFCILMNQTELSQFNSDYYLF